MLQVLPNWRAKQKCANLQDFACLVQAVKKGQSVLNQPDLFDKMILEKFVKFIKSAILVW